MPWKEKSTVDQRKELIARCRSGEESIAWICRELEISRQTAYKFLKRYEETGEEGLADLSRAPHHRPGAMREGIAERILEARRKHPRWGPRKLRADLVRQDEAEKWPSASSIGDLLKREGLVAGRRKRARVPPYGAPLQHADTPNRVWCADFKGWFRCGDGKRCDPLTATDACSRFLLRCRAVEKTDGPHVRSVFEVMFQEYGLPDAIRTDNGPPFASGAPGGLSRLAMWWMQLGIRHERIDPGCPQQNGRHERMHQTLKQETASPPKGSLKRQQEAFQAFEREYNYERPHEALQYRTPAEVYRRSQRAYPARLPDLEYPPGAHLRWVSQQGSVKWKNKRTFLSEVLARQAVGLIELEEDYFEVYYGPILIGWMDGVEGAFERADESGSLAGDPRGTAD